MENEYARNIHKLETKVARLEKLNSELEVFLDAFPDLYFWTDPAGVILRYHAREKSELYVPPAYFLGKNVKDVLPPAIGEQFSQAIKEALHSSGLTPPSLHYVLKYGKKDRYFEASISQAAEQTVLIAVRDRTAQEESRFALEQKNRVLQTISDFDMQANTLNLPELRERVLRFFCERFEIEQAALLFPQADSRQFAVFLSDRDSNAGKAFFIDADQSIFPRIMSSSQPLLPKNSKVWMKKYPADRALVGGDLMAVFAEPLPGKDGSLAAVALFARSAEELAESERQALEIIVPRLAQSLNNAILHEQVAETRNRLQTIADTAVDSIFCKDQARRYTFVNKAMQKLLHRDADKILGKTPEELFSPEDCEVIKKVDDGAFAGKTVSERRELDIAGQMFTFHTIQVPLVSQDGAIREIAGIVRDVTEQSRRQQLLEEEREALKFDIDERRSELHLAARILQREMAERKKIEQEKIQFQVKALEQGKLAAIGQLATGIAHEINQPLTFLKICYETWLRDLRDLREIDHEECIKDCGEALYQIKRITRIIDGLRAFGRGDVEVKSELFLGEVLDRVLILMQERLRLRNIRLVVEVDPELRPISGSLIRLEQLFINLIQNAIDALQQKRKGQIRIRITNHQDGVLVVFRDTGRGMRAEEKRKIFEPFFTTKETGKGTGLGLSIVYGIVREHDGAIECHSRFGRYTEFTLFFPVAEEVPEK